MTKEESEIDLFPSGPGPSRTTRRLYDGKISTEEFVIELKRESAVITAVELERRDEAWPEVKTYLDQAASEYALELGGEELQERVIEACAIKDAFPSAQGLLLLETIQEGASYDVVQLARQIQVQENEREQKEANSFKNKLRSYGRGILRMFS